MAGERRGRAGRVAAVAALVVALGSGCIWDIGTLPGHTFSYAEDVNDAGLVVGWSAGSQFAQSTWRPMRWSPGQPMHGLPLLPGDQWGTADGVNASGISVGKSCRDSIQSCRAVRWDTDGRALALPIAVGAHPSDISASGVVVGDVIGADGYPSAFAWSPGDTAETRLPLPTGVRAASAEAVNSSGQIAGSIYGDPGYEVARWRVGSPDVELHGAGMARDINTAGTMVGDFEAGIATWGPEPTSVAVVVEARPSAPTSIADDGSVSGSLSESLNATIWRAGRAPEGLGKLDGQVSYVKASSPGGKRVGAATTKGTWHAVRYFSAP